MSTTITAFENQLVNKLQFKASSKVTPDALLFKTFKFFDLYNNGYLTKNDFFRAIAKCGVIVETHNMEEVFMHYSQEDKIYYKQFIEQLLFKDISNIDNKSTISQNSQLIKSKLQHSQKSDNKLAKSKIQEFYQNCETIDEILEYIRKNLRKEGITGILSFANKLKASDPQKTHKINAYKLKGNLSSLQQHQIKTIIQQFNPNPQGQINYAELIYSVKGDPQPQRKALIQKTFALLDQSNAKQIEVKIALEKYKGNNKQEYQNAINLYCLFQSIDDGYLTDEDFVDLFQFLSFYFVGNQGFRSFIMTGYFENEDTKSHKSNKSRRQFDRQSNRHQNIQNRKIEHQPVPNFKKNKNSNQQERQNQDFDEFEEQIQKKSVSRHSRSSKQLSHSSHVKQVELIILRIKKRLASKGTKGFLLFQKALRNADSDSDGLVNLEQFKKVIKEQRVDITNTQSNIVFDVFDQQHTGLVDFGSLVYTIKGQVPTNRKAIFQRIWKRVKKNDQITTFNNIKQMVNLRGHPDIQNGKRYEEDIMKEIQDTILIIQDLNQQPRNQQITKNDFIQYLQNFSLSIPQDQLFQIVAQNFWKMVSETRIEDQYAGSRKLFDPKNKSYLMDHHRYAIKGGSSTSNAPYGTFAEPTNYTTENRRL